MRKLLLTGAAITALALPANAADLALLLGNANYDRMGDVKGAAATAQSQSGLKRVGFTILDGQDADAGDLRARFRAFVSEAQDADTVVVALSGRFMHSASETWFMPVDARDGSLPEAVSEALPLSAVLTVLAAHPGRAVLLLGAEASDDTRLGLTRPGLGRLHIPQGVSVLRGMPKHIAEFLGGDLVAAGVPLARSAQARGLAVSGYLPADLSLVGALEKTTPGAATQTQTPESDPASSFWDLAQSEDTQPAYQRYLDLYPDGAHAPEARARIAALAATPEQKARSVEDALGLTRAQRREVQQNLTVLDYDPKGVDGIFGPGSRGAIARWQRANGFDDSSYLTRDQLTKLSAQGAKRAAELEAESRARQAEIDRQDRAYWSETGKAGDEPGLRAYLGKYPDGLFADLAQERLQAIEATRRADAQSADRADWDAARRADTVAAYRDYLSSRDRPAFQAEAEARIAELQQKNRDRAQDARAKATEDALGLPAVARQLVERRLSQMGLKPGKVDGVFTPETRRAIRRYQAAGGLPATGYLDQATVAQLLAGAIGLQ